MRKFRTLKMAPSGTLTLASNQIGELLLFSLLFYQHHLSEARRTRVSFSSPLQVSVILPVKRGGQLEPVERWRGRKTAGESAAMCGGNSGGTGA